MNAQPKRTLDVTSWADEIAALAAGAPAHEKEAIRCFQAAMRPYLEDPTRLRTLLGKIAAPGTDQVARLALIARDRKFATVEEIQSLIDDESVQVRLE